MPDNKKGHLPLVFLPKEKCPFIHLIIHTSLFQSIQLQAVSCSSMSIRGTTFPDWTSMTTKPNSFFWISTAQHLPGFCHLPSEGSVLRDHLPRVLLKSAYLQKRKDYILFRSVQYFFQSLQDNFCHSHFVFPGIITDTLIHRIFHPDTQHFLFYIFRLWSSYFRHICSYFSTSTL